MRDWVGEFLARFPDRRAALVRLFGLLGDANGVVEGVRSGRLDVVDVLQGVVDRLVGEGLAPKTVEWYVSWLKRFFRFARVRIDSESLRALERPKKANVRIDRAPSIGEVKTMVIAAQSRQLSVFIHLLATTGLRLSEALSLKVENFDFNAEPPILKIISAKTNLPREVPLTAELASRLKEIMPSGGRVFGYNRRSAYNSIRYLLSRLNLRKKDASGRGYELHPHSFRKFYKTRLEEAGVNPLLIEMWMGHVTGVVHAYFKPNKKMILEEWAKAEKALTLFREEEPRYEEVKRIHELEAELAALKRQLSDILAQLQGLHNTRHVSRHP